jgi:hypothetical protein
VERLASAELMRLGVLQVGPLVLDREPTVVEPGKKLYFQIQHGPEYPRTTLDLLFDEEIDARDFLENASARILKTERLNDDWSQRIEVAENMALPRLTTTEAISAADFHSSKAALEKRSAIRSANAKREEEWVKEKQKEDDALRGMWSDWQRCRDLDAAHRRVSATFDSYVSTAGGDREVAFRFLRKAFADPQIVAAAEWCGFTAPSPFSMRDDRIDEIHAASSEAAQ